MTDKYMVSRKVAFFKGTSENRIICSSQASMDYTDESEGSSSLSEGDSSRYSESEDDKLITVQIVYSKLKIDAQMTVVKERLCQVF